jgi:hypothetical protein
MLGIVNGVNGGAAIGVPLSADMATAVVGGINELVLQYIERDRVGDLLELVAPSSQLLRAVTGACGRG